MPDLTLAVAMWWVGTCVACLLLGMALNAIWSAVRSSVRALRTTDVAPERIARAKAAGAAAGRATVMRSDGLAQTNLMMAAVDSPVPGLIGEPLLTAVPEPDYLDLLVAEESQGLDALAEAVRKVQAEEPDLSDAFDVFGTDDDPAAPEPGWDDDEDQGGTPAEQDATLTMTISPPRRYRWKTCDPDGPLAVTGEPVIPRSPAGWVHRSAALFRRHRPDVRAALWLLGLWPPLHHWVVRMLAASVHKARHAARAGAVSWSDNAHLVTERLELEWQTRAEQLRARLDQAEQRTAAWRGEIVLMTEALRPPRRTPVFTLPSMGCQR